MADLIAETSVFLYSRLNSLITVYHFRTTETEPPRPFSSSDPMRFSLDDLLNPLQEAQHVIGLHLEPLGIREAEQRLETGPGPTYFARDVQFYHLTVMLSDRSVHQAVFYSSPHTTNLDSEGPLLVEPPTWTATIQRRAPGLHSGKDAEHDEGFILQNGMDELSPSLRPAYRNRSTSASGRRSFSDRSDQVAEIDTANFTTIYDSLSRGVLVETGDDKPEVEDVSAIIVRADDTLQKTESNMAPGSTL